MPVHPPHAAYILYLRLEYMCNIYIYIYICVCVCVYYVYMMYGLYVKHITNEQVRIIWMSRNHVCCYTSQAITETTMSWFCQNRGHCRLRMMTSSNGNIFRVTGPLSPVNSPNKGQWRGALMFSLICAWINDSVNNRKAGDQTSSRPLWRHCNGKLL